MKTIYPKEELRALNDLLDTKYNGGKTRVDIERWMMDEGAMNERGAILMEHDGEKWLPPAKYAILQDKLAQAGKLLSRKEYAIKKGLEELDKSKDEVINSSNLEF